MKLARVFPILLLLSLITLGWDSSGNAQSGSRSFAGTGRIETMWATGAGCQATLKLHRVFSSSQNFGTQPSIGSKFNVNVNSDDCLTLQVAMTQSDSGHIFFILGENPKGEWRFTIRPRPPTGCSG